MSEKLVVVGSASDAARNWHLAAGAIFSARFGVKFTPKSTPAGGRREDRNGGGERESAS